MFNKFFLKKKNQSMSKRAIILIVGRIIAFVLNLFLPFFLVRILDPVQYGSYKQLLLIHLTFFPILQLGISQSLYYFYPREDDKRDILILQTFVFLFINGLIFFLVIIFFKNFLSYKFIDNNLLLNSLGLVGLFTWFMVPGVILEILLIVEGRINLASLITILSMLVRVVLVFIFAYFTQQVYFLFIALILFSFFRLSFLIIYIFKRYFHKLKFFNYSFFKRELIYSLPFGLATIIVTLNNTIDKYTISFLYTPDFYAIYANGCYQIPVITIILNSVLEIVLPKMSLLQKESKLDEIITLWHNAIRKLAIIVYPIFIFSFVFADEIVVLIFTKQYLASIPVFRIYLFIIFIDVTIYGVILRTFGKTPYILKSALISFILAIILIYPMTKIFGLPGAAVVVIIAHAVKVILQIIKSKKLLKINFTSLLPWKILCNIFIIALISTCLLLPIKYYINLNLLLKVSSVSILNFGLYLAMLWVFGILRYEEKQKIKNYIKIL